MNRKNIRIVIIVSVLFVVSFLVWLYIGRNDISTDNAYLESTIINIAPRVTGVIQKIFVSNNQYIKKGQPIYLINQDTYQLALQKAQSNLNIRQAMFDESKADFQRTLFLYKKHTISKAIYDSMLSRLKNSTAALSLAHKQLQDANNNLLYTTVRAPTDGVISNFHLGVGDPVHAYEPNLALISGDFWVEANYKETEIAPIRVGNCATIKLDIYPDQNITGYVQSISYGTGDIFSLLPSQNATGNWVKVTRRITIRIAIPKRPKDIIFRAGTSAEVTIHTSKQCAVPYN